MIIFFSFAFLYSQSLTRLLETYDTSLKSGKLSEEMCKRYLDTLEMLGHDHHDAALSASSLATDLHLGSVELWQRRLSVVADGSGEGGGAGGRVRTRRSKVTRKTGGGGGGGGGARVGELCQEALEKVPKKVGSLCCWSSNCVYKPGNFHCKNIFVVDVGYENWHALLTLMR